MNAASSLVSRALGWFPVVATAVAIWLFSVEVPTQDDWDTPGAALEAWLKGDLTWKHLFAQHNESRFAIPRLIMLASSVAFGGFRTVPWMFVSWFLMALSVWALRRWGWSGENREHVWLGVVGAFLFCVPTQTENLTWGGQLGLFVPGLSLILAHAIARQPWAPSRQYLLCGALAWTSTFSFANGMIVWVLGCPLWFQLLRRERIRLGGAQLAYAAAAVATIACYFHGYVKPAGHPSLLTGLQQPGRLALYFLTWLGGPFSMGVHRPVVLCPVLGAAMLGLVATGLWAAWRRRMDLPVVAHLWLVMLAYGLACGVVTSLGRCGFELATALAPRYTTFALWVPLASVGLLFAVGSAAARVALGALGALLLLAWPSGWYGLNNRRLALEQDRVTMRLADALPGNPLLTRLHPDAEPTVARIRFYAAKGWLPPVVSAAVLERLVSEATEGITAGAIDGVPGRTGGNFVGWAMNPATRTAASYVVIATQGADGRWRPWTGVRVGNHRPDVAKAHGTAALERCGFEVRLPFWPEGPWRAVAVHEPTGRSFLLLPP